MENNDLNKQRLDYLKATHLEVRNEIAMRIQQRDAYANQFIVSTGVVLGVGFIDFPYSSFLFFLLPILAIFYSIQIMYSYTIHDRCHRFLETEIEPKMAEVLEFSKGNEDRLFWERYCEYKSREMKTKTPGIRQGFFQASMFVVPLIASLLFVLLSAYRKVMAFWQLMVIAVGVFVFFEAVSAFILLRFRRGKKK